MSAEVISIIPDILRAVVTDTMLVILLHTVSTPKFKNKLPYILTTVILVAINLLANVYFYLQDNYSAVALVDFLMLLFIGVALKPLFLERISHWVFAFVTVLNVYAIIVFVTWIASDLFPFPLYANTILRFLFFGGVIIVFRRWMMPIYRRIVEQWYAYILLLVSLLVNMVYYFLYGDDIELTLTVGEWPIILLIILGVCIYISIFHGMKSNLREYELREENNTIRAQEALLQSELISHNEFLEQARRNRHDLRHHNALLMEYLTHEDLAGAKEYLRQYDGELLDAKLTDYCKNPVANTVLRRYARRGSLAGTQFRVCAEIPEELPLSSPEIGVLISNVLENACEACEKSGLPYSFILLTAETEDSRLKMEVCNTVGCKTSFDENGMPITTKDGGGTGTRSIKHIVQKHGGMLNFRQSENTFITQIILPLK